MNINSATAIGSGTLTILAGTIDNTSGAAITLSNNNPLAWNGNFTFAGTNNLNLGTGAVTLGGSKLATITAGTLTIGGAIGDGGSGYAVTKAGAGTLTLTGANTFSGGTTLSAGQLNINSATALGSGTFTINGGTIDNTSGGAITLSNNNAQTWGGDFTFTGSNALNLGTGAVTLGANRTVTVSASTLTEGGIIGGGFSLTKAGAGTLTLTGATHFPAAQRSPRVSWTSTTQPPSAPEHSPSTAARSTTPAAQRSPSPTTTLRPGAAISPSPAATP